MESDNKIPEKVKRLFWDVNKEGVYIKAHQGYIIQRILDYGDIGDIRWMLNTYSREEIIKVLKKRRGISRKSAFFWSYYFDIPKEEMECLKKHYPKNSKPF